jgi:uncharacterized protein YjbI with pentapeptide repeats
MANINAKGLRLAIKQQFLASRRRWLSAMDAAWFDIAKGIIKHLTSVGDPTMFLSSTGEWAVPAGGGGGVTDGDKGDITVTVTGTVWTIDNNAVTTAKIADANVTAAKLAADSVTTAKILDANVTTAKILDANVTTAKILDANVTTAKIADANVTSGKLAADSVTTAKIADANVTSGKLAADSVTTAKIADANVTTAKIADANVTTAKIADANVTTAKIADANVTTAKILDANVTTAKIADANVTLAKLANLSAYRLIGRDNVAAGVPGEVSGADLVGSNWIPTFTNAARGLVPSSGTADGTKVLRDDGTWTPTTGISSGDAFAWFMGGS